MKPVYFLSTSIINKFVAFTPKGGCPLKLVVPIAVDLDATL